MSACCGVSGFNCDDEAKCHYVGYSATSVLGPSALPTDLDGGEYLHPCPYADKVACLVDSCWVTIVFFNLSCLLLSIKGLDELPDYLVFLELNPVKLSDMFFDILISHEGDK